MLILAIDTSTKLCSVALYDDKQGMLGEMNIVVAKNHSNIILPVIDQVFAMTEKTIDDVERIAVGMGPGSFTGIRVGMAIAKGLAIGKNIDLVGISGLEALAFSAPKDGRIFSFIDAKKGRVYYQVFDGETPLGEAQDGKVEEVLEKYQGQEKNYFVGDGALAYMEKIQSSYPNGAMILFEEQSLMRALSFAKLAVSKQADNLYTLEPFYICKSQAEKAKEKV